MKRMAQIVTVAVVVAFLSVLALGVAAAATQSAAKPAVVNGELIDMGCYVGHMAKGEKHAECATKCISGGMPMGVLTAKGQVYLLTMDHDNPDAYNKAKEFAGKQVKVTGPMHVRSGIKSIDVGSVEAVASAK